MTSTLVLKQMKWNAQALIPCINPGNFQAPVSALPTRQPRKKVFQALPPSKISKHIFQAADASSFPSGAPNQMSEDFFFGPCDFPALTWNCTL